MSDSTKVLLQINSPIINQITNKVYANDYQIQL